MSKYHLWGAGFGFAPSAGYDMQRIDAGYLYELGAAIRPLRGLGYGEMSKPWQAWQPLVNVRDTVRTFAENSIYSAELRSSPAYAQALLVQVEALIDRIENFEWPQQTDEFQAGDVVPVARAFASFEPVMIAEIQSRSIFHVPTRGAYDSAYLIDQGEALFPASLIVKVPETLMDVRQGARCIAFDLPTASGFHFHRANEAVLRKYYDGVSSIPRADNASMGVLLGAMKTQNVGEKPIIAALDNIKEFHRNPLMHPEHTIADVDEAISLYCALRSAMSYMLDRIT